MRRTIAKRLSDSMFTAPHFYVTVEVGMEAAIGLRDELQDVEDVKVTYNDLVVKAVAKALTRFRPSTHHGRASRSRPTVRSTSASRCRCRTDC